MKPTIIVVHLPRRWEQFHRRYMLLALSESLPPNASILCVDRPVTLDATWWREPARFLRKIWRENYCPINDRIGIATVRTPLHDDVLTHIPWMSHLNSTILSRQVKKIIHTLAPNGAKVVQWIYRPEQYWVRFGFPDAPLVYECYDEYSSAADGTHLANVWKMEEQLLRVANLTFVTAQSLFERRASLANDIRLIPNGIHAAFLEESTENSDPIDAIPHPRIGYVGVIRQPMNMPLIRDVFERKKSWQLVMVGPVEPDSGAESLRKLPNVHFVGPRRFENLPSVLSHLDVGLIPLCINDFSAGIRPLKLAEYLSAGLPVVATRLPELSGMESLVSLTDDDTDSMVSAISAALERKGPEFTLIARKWAREFTWAKIAERDVVPALGELQLL